MHHPCEVQLLVWAWENVTFSLELFPGDLQRSVPQNGRVHLLVLELSALGCSGLAVAMDSAPP